MKRTNFAFRYEWSRAIAHLSPETRLEIFEATVRYAETGETGPMTEAAAEAFSSFILPDFERRRKAADYRARAKARKALNEHTDNQPTESEPVAVVELEPIVEEPRIIEAPAGPNRRERRLLQAEEKRLQKRRTRNAPARAKKREAEIEAQSSPALPPLPRMYNPFWF